MEKSDIIEDNNAPDKERGKNYFDKVVALAIGVGCELLSSGCPVGRVEMAVDYMCKAFGAVEVNVFVIPSMIFTCIKIEDGSEISQMKRLYSVSNNFSRMQIFNQLSRDICDHNYTLDEAVQMLAHLKRKSCSGKLVATISGGIASGSLAVFYGGSLIDAVPALFIGALMAFLSCILSRLAFNGYARTFILSLIGGVLSTLTCWLIRLTGLYSNLSAVMMGTIMIVIPGLMLSNAVRDLFTGDIYSGTFELLNAIITTLAIVAGYAVAMMGFRAISPGIVDVSQPPARSGELAEYLYRILSCITGTLAFTIYFGGSPKKLLPSEINSMVTFGVYLVMERFVGNEFINTVVATVAAAILSEVFARTFKAPSVIFFVPGIIILVPGRSLYYTVSNIVSGNSSQSLVWGTNTLMSIVGIAVGIIIVTLLFQLIKPNRHHRYLRRKINREKLNKGE